MNRRDFVQRSLASAAALAGVNAFSSPLKAAAPNKRTGPADPAAHPWDYPWKLGLITDEADPDLPHVLRDFVPHYGLKWVEIRDVRFDGRNVYLGERGAPMQVKQVQEELRRAGVRVSTLDTGVYKVRLPGTEGQASAGDLNRVNTRFHEQLEILKHACGVAHQLGTRQVRVFTFLRVPQPETVFTRVVDEVHKALRVAEAEDIELVVENEFDCNVATGEETAAFFRAIPDRRLGHNWDPGNCYFSGEQPFPKAWDLLDHSRIVHMHLKDAVRLPNGHFRWMPVGGGDNDFIGQFKALKAMKFAGTMSLETHYRNAAHDPWTSSMESMDGIFSVLSKV